MGAAAAISPPPTGLSGPKARRFAVLAATNIEYPDKPWGSSGDMNSRSCRTSMTTTNLRRRGHRGRSPAARTIEHAATWPPSASPGMGELREQPCSTGRIVMRRKLLGICGVLLFGMFSGLSGAFAAPAPVLPSGTSVAAETCNVCVSSCANMLAVLMRDCSNRRKFRTEMQVALCRASANEEYGRCLAECDHNKKK